MKTGQIEPGDSLRQSMALVHTWAGLVPGWLVFLVFLFGSAAFFQQEVSAWMRPELRGMAVSAKALEAADARLASQAQGAESWYVSLPHPRGGDALGLAWPPKADGGDWTTIDLDPATGRPTQARATEGGMFLFKFHYNFHYIPYWLGRYIILIASLAMLVAILSGIVTHKKIFADFFMLRFGKGQRSWLDAHNVTSVLALPFHLMITYTGLVIFAYMLMPLPIAANFASEDAYFDAAYPHAHAGPASGRPAAMMPLAALAARAEAVWGHLPASIEIQNPGDAAAIAELQPPKDRLGHAAAPIRLNAVTGADLNGARPASGPEITRDVMVQLHAGWFAAPVLRWLYFVAGLSGTVMIASGLVLWTVKRRAKLPDPARPHFGFRLVERLNIGIIAGATGGIPVYFLANRLLPLGLAHRAAWEIHSLFIAWGALFVWSLGRPAKRAWIETLATGAALYAAVPVTNTVTTERGLVPGLLAGDWVFVGFDLVMLAMAALLALAARRMARHKPRIATRRASRSPLEAAA
jgi:uncharacterized iron-regulated membrane protein